MKSASANKIWITLLILFSGMRIYSQTTIVGQQCEHLLNPIGIDAVQPRLSWRMSENAKWKRQTAYQVRVAKDSLQLVKKNAPVWNTGKVQSEVPLVTYNGKALEPFTKYYWQVNVWDERGKMLKSAVASFETGPMNFHDWQGEWITDTRNNNIDTAAYFRKTFLLDKEVRSARVYIAVAGLYELYVNGKRIGDHLLDPMFTRYDRRNLYATYDITNDLQQGKNVIAVHLGNGWYNMMANAAWGFNKAPWRNRPRLCLDMKMTYTDGTVRTVSTGKGWKTILGPVVYNDIYVGEHYDTNKGIRNWNEVDADDSKWKNVIIATSPSQQIVAQSLYPIRATEKLIPVSMTKFNDTDYVFDLGKNSAGISEIKIKADSGTIIQIKHAEQLDSAGHADQAGIDQHYYDKDKIPFQADIYYLNEKEHTLKPHFSYKGFQYVEVTSNRPIQLTREHITAYFIHSDVPVAGRIQSSNPLINKIWEATNRSYLSNLMGYPTDCPQREKNGWTGDAHIAVETGLYNFDAITIYEKWLADFRVAQQPDGRLPAIVPTNEWSGYDNHNGPDWVSAVAIIPWELYQFYGDIQPLKENYEVIKSYVGLLERNFPTGLCNWGLGDWVPVRSFAPVEFTSTIYYYTDVLILANTANLLNKKEDAEHFTALAKKIRESFNNKYLDEATGNYDQGLQTELSAALFWKIVPANVTSKTAKLLANRVIADGKKLDVGLLGSKTILHALSDNGYADLAFELASSDQYPSWGYWIANGATTLYEGWRAGKKGLDFSLNHIMFGEISAWMYQALGGIKPDPVQPGFKNILLQPSFVDGLDSFYCYHDGPFGRIESAWKRRGKEIIYTVTIPPNSTAEIRMPDGKIVNAGAGTYHYKIRYGTK